MRLIYKIIYVVLLLAITVIPAIGANYFDWPLVYIKGVYWTELSIIITLAVVYYHKYLMVYIVTLLLSLTVFSIEGSDVWQDIRIPATFWAVYSGCGLIYFELGRSRFGQWIKSLHPITHFSYYIVFMTVTL